MNASLHNPIPTSKAEVAPRLSQRQREIIELLAQGKSNKEISYALDITAGTVKQHLFTLFKKIGVTNRTRAVVVAQDLLAQQGRHESDHAAPPVSLKTGDYSWKLITAVAVVYMGSQPRSPKKIAALEDLLKALRDEVRRLVQMLDGQIIVVPGGHIVAGFGAPQSHLDDASRGVFLAKKIAYWCSQEAPIPIGLGIATAATLVGYSRETHYRSEAFDLAISLAKKSQRGQILATDVACKSAGITFHYKDYGSGEDSPKFVVKEISVDQDTDLELITKRVPLPFIEEHINICKQGKIQWIGVEGWPPSACLQLLDSIAAHTGIKGFHAYRLRLATKDDPEAVAENIFQQLKVIARLRERRDGNTVFEGLKTNSETAITALKVLCMRGPTTLLLYGVNSLAMISKAFGDAGLKMLSQLPLMIVGTSNKPESVPYVTVRIFGESPTTDPAICLAYRLNLPRAPRIPDGVDTDLATMIDMLTPAARLALKTFVKSQMVAMKTGEKESGMMIGKEFLISGLFKLNDGLIIYRDETTAQALQNFFIANDESPVR